MPNDQLIIFWWVEHIWIFQNRIFFSECSQTGGGISRYLDLDSKPNPSRATMVHHVEMFAGGCVKKNTRKKGYQNSTSGVLFLQTVHPQKKTSHPNVYCITRVVPEGGGRAPYYRQSNSRGIVLVPFFLGALSGHTVLQRYFNSLKWIESPEK